MPEITELKAVQADLWVFDSDGTLYDDKRIQSVVTKLMDRFFARTYGVKECEGQLLREKLKKKHAVSGTLMALYREGISVETFIRETYLAVDFHIRDICPPTAIAAVVSHLTGEKVLLTNSPSEFARRILKVLVLEDSFSRVYGIRELDYFSKPAREAFRPILDAVREGKRVVYIDDKVDNLKAASTTGCIARFWWNGRHLVEIGGENEAP